MFLLFHIEFQKSMEGSVVPHGIPKINVTVLHITCYVSTMYPVHVTCYSSKTYPVHVTCYTSKTHPVHVDQDDHFNGFLVVDTITS